MNKIYPRNKEILDNKISRAISELFNVEITEHIKASLEDIASMISVNTHI